jgi:hypothetical protein
MIQLLRFDAFHYREFRPLGFVAVKGGATPIEPGRNSDYKNQSQRASDVLIDLLFGLLIKPD